MMFPEDRVGSPPNGAVKAKLKIVALKSEYGEALPKKTNRKVTSPKKLASAIKLVKDGWAVRSAARQQGICRHTLWKAVNNKYKDKIITDAIETESTNLNLNYGRRAVIPLQLEDSIASYCIDLSNIGYGLNVSKVRELAYEMAITNKIDVPNSWSKNKIAGIEWFRGFKARHPNLSVRVPEGCSIARAVAFNKPNVDIFFEKLQVVLSRHPSFMDGSRLYNMDETSTSTVQNMRKVVSPKGVKQVHQVQTAERGTTVTTCCFIGAHGIVIPPVMIFPRQYFKSNMTLNAFPGTLGLANKKGYMTKVSFLEVLKHFVKCTNSSKENPTLLLIDNVETHLSLDAINFARENGVTLFTFPPHCTHKLQPLDVGIYGPFKAYYDNAINSWIMANPGVAVTIYHIAGFVREALSKSATPSNIIASFAKPGIFPFNAQVFQESDFLMASVTFQPDPTVTTSQSEDVIQEPLRERENGNGDTPAQPVASNSATNEGEVAATPSPSNGSSFVSPADIRGYPRKTAKASTRKPRRKGKCMIVTDTPEKMEIEKREREQEEKRMKIEERKKNRERKKKENQIQKGKNQKKKRKVSRALDFSESDSEDVDNPSSGSDESENDESLTVNKTPKPVDKPVAVNKTQKKVVNFKKLTRSPTEGEYVLVHFSTGNNDTYYVGKILKEEDDEGDLEISYLKKTDCDRRFVLPPKPDIHSVNVCDIKAILPKPSYPESTTKRQRSFMLIDYDFSKIKLG